MPEALFNPDAAVPNASEARVERAARALFKRDAKRGQLAREAYPHTWRRVRPEYVEQATVALDAADAD